MPIEKLQQQVKDLKIAINFFDHTNAPVSKASVGWHIEHALLVIKNVIIQLEKSDAKNYKRRFNMMRTIVFTLGKIPRGRGKAPASVLPSDHISSTGLHTLVENVADRITTLSQFSPGLYFNHPLFGHIRLNKTIKFLTIHTRHHLFIINDILKKSN